MTLAESSSGRARVLLLSVPLRGHLVHLTRLAEWLVERGHTVHIGCHPDSVADIPVGVQVHVATEDEWALDWVEESNRVFLEVGRNSHGWTDSFAQMIQSSCNEEGVGNIVRLVRFGVRVIKDVKPDVVVSDVGYNVGNMLHTYCNANGVRYVAVISPGRPDPITSIWTLMRLLFGHFGTVVGSVRLLSKVRQQLEPHCGKPLGLTDPPVSIMPGSKSVAKVKPGKNELFTGSFLPLPQLDGAGAQGPREAFGGTSIDASLLDWMFSTRNLNPIVYVAFGTLVRPDHALLGRLCDALGSGSEGTPWRVLWSLPGDLHELLPAAAQVGSHRWRIETFVPQTLVLRCERVRCFFSHCGSNSTHESMAYGVPMVCLPFYADQYDWSASVCKGLGAGILVDKFRSDVKALRQAVADILQKPMYRENAQAAMRSLQVVSNVVSEELGHVNAAGVPAAAAVILGNVQGGPKVVGTGTNAIRSRL